MSFERDRRFESISLHQRVSCEPDSISLEPDEAKRGEDGVRSKRADLIVGRTPPNEPVPDYDALLGQGVRGLRIGVIRHFYTKDVVGDPEQVQALDEAVKLFAEAGAEISEIILPSLQDFRSYSKCAGLI